MMIMWVATHADNYGFVYNGDSKDDSGPIGQLFYGTNPPMQSTVILNGPVSDLGDNVDNDNDGSIDEAGERSLMTNFVYYNNNGSTTGKSWRCHQQMIIII